MSVCVCVCLWFRLLCFSVAFVIIHISYELFPCFSVEKRFFAHSHVNACAIYVWLCCYVVQHKHYRRLHASRTNNNLAKANVNVCNMCAQFRDDTYNMNWKSTNATARPCRPTKTAQNMPDVMICNRTIHMYFSNMCIQIFFFVGHFVVSSFEGNWKKNTNKLLQTEKNYVKRRTTFDL